MNVVLNKAMVRETVLVSLCCGLEGGVGEKSPSVDTINPCINL